MAKFLSFDGVDANGVRAEVMVQTGTGRVKEIVGRGKQSEDGSYRNVEVVFDPDNPHLKRKVYALLDTTAKDLWEYVQAAHADQRDIAYRIESQRKRAVDRSKKFDDLIHTEEVVRVLAAVDAVFSHEAKTNPKEDPSSENPSALDQDLTAAAVAPVGRASVEASASSLVAAVAAARHAEMSATTVDTLVAMALAAGASVAEVQSAGYSAEDEARPRPVMGARVAASEERPWTAFNSDGRVNAGSYMVAHAAHAEQFALDHLVGVYSEGKKSRVDVSEQMIAQAASVALVLLEIGDDVQLEAVGRADRQKNSYNRALSLVLDAVEKRYPVPVGGNQEAQVSWRAAVTAEAGERLYGVLEVAQGRVPLSAAERAAQVAAPAAAATATVAAPAAAAAAGEPVAAPAVSGADLLAAEFGATAVQAPWMAFAGPGAEDPGFQVPSSETVERVRALCVGAGVDGEPKLISNWLERHLGQRATRKVHAPVLEAFVAHFEAAGAGAVRSDVLGGVAA